MNWALDDDLRLTRRALKGIVEFTGLDKCDVVHSVWWKGLADLPKESLVGKRIICQIPGEPFRYFSLPHYNKTAAVVGQWISQTKEAEKELISVAINSRLIPYIVDNEVFRPIPADDTDLIAFQQDWSIPSDSYVIGNFHRDTEGHDLKSPKWMKGPDVFLEIARALIDRGHNIRVLLAGPRRFWMRKRLSELGIPYIFIGKLVESKDDMSVNILPRPILNLLYNLIDLYVISSRTEGGPRSIMEAASSQCKVISTRVGLALDILEADCIYSSPVEAVDIIEKDIQSDHLRTTIEPHYQRVMRNHQPSTVVPLFRDLYSYIGNIPPFAGYQRGRVTASETHKSQPVHARVLRWFTRRSRANLTLGMWHKFVKPPFGGGNQFMIALSKAMQQKGVRIVENRVKSGIDAYILNSIWFDVESFREYRKKSEVKIIHRIDGPIYLLRGTGRDLDDLCFELNTEFASTTVLQSAWTYQHIVEMGYQPVNPIIIHNAVDGDIFHSKGRIPFDPERRIRLISMSWSDNPSKGGPIYKWIEEHLDWDRFEYTFVGRVSERFDRIRQIPPVSSEDLADILRQHDIYITASKNDPCSNALIEALTCGLPALYLNDGGHPELVGYGGLPFKDVDEIISQLDILVDNYETFQNLILVPTLDEVAQKYLTLLRDVA